MDLVDPGDHSSKNPFLGCRRPASTLDLTIRRVCVGNEMHGLVEVAATRRMGMTPTAGIRTITGSLLLFAVLYS